MSCRVIKATNLHTGFICCSIVNGYNRDTIFLCEANWPIHGLIHDTMSADIGAAQNLCSFNRRKR